jgi:hypothetical protein
MSSTVARPAARAASTPRTVLSREGEAHRLVPLVTNMRALRMRASSSSPTCTWLSAGL